MMTLLPTENWQYTGIDLVRGLASVLSKRKAPQTIYVPGLGECIPTRSARVGLMAAIRSLDLSPGARIGVPLYCCPVVFKAIREAGCTPWFIDIDLETYCMSAEDLHRKSSDVDAVIPVHMFGNLCDVSALQEAARGKPMIEDCAQAIGSKLDGRMAGSFGSIAVFSFRSGKYLSVGEGGALFSGDAAIRSRLCQAVAGMPVPSFADECVHMVVTWLRSMLRSRPLYGLVGYPLWAVYNRQVDFAAKSPIVVSQIYATDLATVKHRLNRVDWEIERQRAIADFYSHNLKFNLNMLCSQKPGAFYNRYLYPILFPSAEQRDSMASYLRKRKIDTAQPYKDVIDGARQHYGYKGDCPVTEEVARGILVIPSYHRLKEGDVDRIAQCVNEGWQQIGKSHTN